MSVVISIRIPKKVKEILDKSGIDWKESVKEYIRRLAMEEAKKEVLEKARELRSKVSRDTGESYKIVREYRDAR